MSKHIGNLLSENQDVFFPDKKKSWKWLKRCKPKLCRLAAGAVGWRCLVLGDKAVEMNQSPSLSPVRSRVRSVLCAQMGLAVQEVELISASVQPSLPLHSSKSRVSWKLLRPDTWNKPPVSSSVEKRYKPESAQKKKLIMKEKRLDRSGGGLREYYWLESWMVERSL